MKFVISVIITASIAVLAMAGCSKEKEDSIVERQHRLNQELAERQRAYGSQGWRKYDFDMPAQPAKALADKAPAEK